MNWFIALCGLIIPHLSGITAIFSMVFIMVDHATLQKLFELEFLDSFVTCVLETNI